MAKKHKKKGPKTPKRRKWITSDEIEKLGIPRELVAWLSGLPIPKPWPPDRQLRRRALLKFWAWGRKEPIWPALEGLIPRTLIEDIDNPDQFYDEDAPRELRMIGVALWTYIQLCLDDPNPDNKLPEWVIVDRIADDLAAGPPSPAEIAEEHERYRRMGGMV